MDSRCAIDLHTCSGTNETTAGYCSQKAASATKKGKLNKDFNKNDTMPGDRSYRNDPWKPDFDTSKGRIK